MDGFKDTTRMTNMEGGSCFAKGGSVRSSSTKSSSVKSVAKASNAGAKSPMKKAEGGPARNRMPPIGDSVDSGNRMSKLNAADRAAVLRTAKKGVPVASRLPMIGDSVDSGNRMSKLNAADRAAVLRTTPRAKGGAMEKKAGGLAAMPKGASKNKGPVRKYAVGGAVAGKATPTSGVAEAHRALGEQLKAQIKAGKITNAQANAMLRQQSPAFQEVRDIQAKRAAQAPTVVSPPPMPAPMYGDGPLRPTTSQLSEYNAGGGKGAWDPVRGAFTNAPPMQPPMQPPMKMPLPTAPRNLLGALAPQAPAPQAPAKLLGAIGSGLAVTPRGGGY